MWGVGSGGGSQATIPPPPPRNAKPWPDHEGRCLLYELPMLMPLQPPPPPPRTTAKGAQRAAPPLLGSGLWGCGGVGVWGCGGVGVGLGMGVEPLPG